MVSSTTLWCGNSPKSGVKTVACLDLGLALFHLIFGLFRIAQPEIVQRDAETITIVYQFQDIPDNWSIETGIAITICVRFFVFVAELTLVYLLFSSIKQHSTFKADLWIKIRSILLIIGLAGYSYENIIMTEYSEQYYLWWIVLALAMIYRIYTILIVRMYYMDLLARDFTRLNSA